eukprot:5039398-Pleurochrysis_carterae.AAC.2
MCVSRPSTPHRSSRRPPPFARPRVRALGSVRVRARALARIHVRLRCEQASLGRIFASQPR